MGAISRWLDRFCYKHPRLGIPGLMKYIVIANVAVYLMDMFSNGYFSAMLRFYPALIMEGQVWRLLTFIFVPTSGGFILWFALTTLFYYYIGNALENQWGSTRFTVFLRGGRPAEHFHRDGDLLDLWCLPGDCQHVLREHVHVFCLRHPVPGYAGAALRILP